MTKIYPGASQVYPSRSYTLEKAEAWNQNWMRANLSSRGAKLVYSRKCLNFCFWQPLQSYCYFLEFGNWLEHQLDIYFVLLLIVLYVSFYCQFFWKYKILYSTKKLDYVQDPKFVHLMFAIKSHCVFQISGYILVISKKFKKNHISQICAWWVIYQKNIAFFKFLCEFQSFPKKSKKNHISQICAWWVIYQNYFGTSSLILCFQENYFSKLYAMKIRLFFCTYGLGIWSRKGKISLCPQDRDRRG